MCSMLPLKKSLCDLLSSEESVCFIPREKYKCVSAL